MPLVRFGEFIDEISQSLGIGTLTISDGRRIKDFLCETGGLGGAEDITRYGGWRAFLASTALAPM